jgi:hypothetical protein
MSLVSRSCSKAHWLENLVPFSLIRVLVSVFWTKDGWQHYAVLKRKELVQAKALAEPLSIATANGGLVQVHSEVGSLAVIQQAKIAVKAKVVNKTLKGIDLIVAGMDCPELSKQTSSAARQSVKCSCKGRQRS